MAVYANSAIRSRPSGPVVFPGTQSSRSARAQPANREMVLMKADCDQNKPGITLVLVAWGLAIPRSGSKYTFSFDWSGPIKYENPELT